MADATAYEQLILEMVNRARLDPAAEAQRFGISLNEGLAPGTISTAAKQPLAGNSLLVDAARGHSQFMMSHGLMGHDDAGDGTVAGRLDAAQYTGRSWWGENIVRHSTGGAIDEKALTLLNYQWLFVDPGVDGRGHRLNILSDNFREIGVGNANGPFNGVNSTITTQNFGTRGSQVFVTGVAINDADGDNFYDVGEGRGGITVSVAGNGSDVTEAAGGYSVGVTPASAYTVTFSGGGLPTPVSATVAGSPGNVKVDLLGNSELLSSAHTTTLGAGAKELGLLGVGSFNATGNGLDNTISGNANANVLSGGAGNDSLYGRFGNDTLHGGDGNDHLDGNGNNDSLFGGNGNDFLDGGGSTDRMDGGAGNDTYVVDAADVVVDSAGIDTVISWNSMQIGTGFENLTLTGTAQLWGAGNKANNVVIGNNAHNTLWGMAGNDTMQGGGGNDLMIGGLGRDVMSGNAGFDDFDFNAVNETGKTAGTRDVIRDFAVGVDDIDLRTIDANGSGVAGNGAFHFIGTKAFTGTEGELRYQKFNSANNALDKTVVSGDINGDKVIDFQIELTGLKTLAVGDFLL